jgi:hypothetical protein
MIMQLMNRPAETKGSTTKYNCNECGRFHYGKCWGRNRERSPYGPSSKIVKFTDNNKKEKMSESADEDDNYCETPVGEEVESDCDITGVVFTLKRNTRYDKSTIVYLDSCANTHVVYNTDLLKDIERDNDNDITVKDIGGTMRLVRRGILPGFGMVHFGCRYRGNVPTPANGDLFNDREAALLSDEERKGFHSCVAKLLYLAKRTRPDILLTVSHLASKVSIPNVDESVKLNRFLRYINSHAKMSLHFRRDRDMDLRAYIDASFAIHADGTSRTGMVIEFGGATICAWTSKQKMATKSACESELVGLSDGSSEVLGCREFLEYQGYNMGPAIIFQDNTSVLDLIKAGRPTSHRTRHLKARYFFIKDYMNAGEIELKHMGTEWMLADYLTKPLCGDKFRRFLDIILGLVDTPL